MDTEVSIQGERASGRLRGKGKRVRDIKESEESKIRDLSCGNSRGHVSGGKRGKQINVLNKQSEKSELAIDVESERARRTSEKMRERKSVKEQEITM